MISSMRPFARTPMRRLFFICLYRSIRFGLAIGIYRHRKVINNKDKIFFAPIGSLSLDLIFAETKTSNNWQNCFIPLIGDRQNFYIKCVKLDFFIDFLRNLSVYLVDTRFEFAYVHRYGSTVFSKKSYFRNSTHVLDFFCCQLVYIK